MKKAIVVVFFISIITECLAQKQNDMIDHLNYYTIAQNRRIAEIAVAHDSLSLSEVAGNTILKRQQFSVVHVEQRGSYYLIYLKRFFPPGRSRLSVAPPPPFGLIVLSYSKERDHLFALREDRLWYTSLEECEKASSNIQFQEKYFVTYYSKPLLESSINGENITTVDKGTLQKIADSWITQLNQGSGKLSNTHNSDIYRAGFLQDNLTRTLIQYHINPSVSMAEFSKKITAYDIKLPPVAQINSGNSNSNSIMGSDTSHIMVPKLH